MKQEELDYFAARLIEEREAARSASSSEARQAHERMAAHYEQALTVHEHAVARRQPDS